MPPAARDITVLVDALYDAHHGWLYAWLRKKLTCPHQAADVAHDTFIRLLTLSRLPCIEEPKAYLATTAKRILIDQARKARIEQAYLESVMQCVDVQAQIPSPEQILAAIQVLERISTMLEGLPQKPREAFLLHHLEDCGHVDIAARLGVSERMVRRYLAQALVHCHQAVLLDE